MKTFSKNDPIAHKRKEESLGYRSIKGAGWLIILRILHRGLGFLRTILLARLLVPGDFGLFGIALLAFNFLENFSVTGISTALVQKSGDIEDYLDSAWTVNLIRAVLIFSILFFGASFVADFFNAPEACNIIKAIAFLQIFLGIENIGVLYLQKNLEFKKIFYLKVSGTVVNVIVSIVLALILKSVWALVIGALAGALVKTAMSYRIHPYRPSLRFDYEKIKELLRFGKWLFGSSILVFMITEGDDIFVGKLLGTTALGLYQMAYLLSNISATELSNLVSQITFPAYSKIQGNIKKLKDSFFRVLQLVAFISFPVSGLIFILAYDFTVLFLGEKWVPMVTALQVLTLWGLIRSIATTTTQVFLAVGKPDISTKLRLIELVLIIIFIYPLTSKWGIVGTSMAIVMGTIMPVIFTCFMTVKTLNANTNIYAKSLLIPFINTSFMIIVIYLSGEVYATGYSMFFIKTIAGLAVYVICAQAFNHFSDYDIWYVIRRIAQEKN